VISAFDFQQRACISTRDFYPKDWSSSNGDTFTPLDFYPKDWSSSSGDTFTPLDFYPKDWSSSSGDTFTPLDFYPKDWSSSSGDTFTLHFSPFPLFEVNAARRLRTSLNIVISSKLISMYGHPQRH